MFQLNDQFSIIFTILVDGAVTWDVIDWDQRRFVSVSMEFSDGGIEDEALAISHLRRHIDDLPHMYHRILVSRKGDIIFKSAHHEDDITRVLYYPVLSRVQLPEGILTIPRDQLEELDRLGPNIDLVFKYCWTRDQVEHSWQEMNIWMRLPHHRNVVPFDRVVVDEVQGRVVGFTSDYIQGGTLDANISRVFKLEWLRQLMDVVDELNLRYDIGHHDIAPRNLLVNESTDCIMLFDFDRAGRIRGCPNRHKLPLEDNNDVKGVIMTMYEIVTRDDTLSHATSGDRLPNPLYMDWPVHPQVNLDHPVAAYRQLLEEWLGRRAPALNGFDVSEAPEAITWPERPKPDVMELGELMEEFNGDLHRQDALEIGGLFVKWERLSLNNHGKGRRYLCSGEVF